MKSCDTLKCIKLSHKKEKLNAYRSNTQCIERIQSGYLICCRPQYTMYWMYTEQMSDMLQATIHNVLNVYRVDIWHVAGHNTQRIERIQSRCLTCCRPQYTRKILAKYSQTARNTFNALLHHQQDILIRQNTSRHADYKLDIRHAHVTFIHFPHTQFLAQHIRTYDQCISTYV